MRAPFLVLPRAATLHSVLLPSEVWTGGEHLENPRRQGALIPRVTRSWEEQDMRKKCWFVAVAIGVAALSGAVPAGAADHLDSPLVKNDARTDITDIYAFQSPENPANTVLIMDVDPLAGPQSPTTFDPKGTYTFNIDNNGDAQADLTVETTFGRVEGSGNQKVKVKVGNGTDGIGDTNGAPISFKSGGKAWAGVVDDPFFFDLQAFNDLKSTLAGTGPGSGRTFCDPNTVDFFRGTNVAAIVVEVPSASLTRGGNPNIGVWATTFSGKTLKDQMGRPAINTVFVGADRKDEFNGTPPSQMNAAFGELFRSDLLFLSGLDGTPYTAEQAAGITNVLLPDILTVDTSSSAGFLNGRQPSNDVIDPELALATGGFFGGSAVLTTDCVNGNDVALPSTFPYLGAKH
jgi:Domain of unknown function (DUF4331)